MVLACDSSTSSSRDENNSPIWPWRKSVHWEKWQPRVNSFKGNGLEELVKKSATHKKKNTDAGNKVRIKESQTRHPYSSKLIKVHFPSVCVGVTLAGLLIWVVMHEDLSHYPLGKPFCQQRQPACVCARVCTHLAPGTVFAQWPDAQFSFTPSPNRWTQGRTYGQFNTDIVPQYHHVSWRFVSYVAGTIRCLCLKVPCVNLGLVYIKEKLYWKM